MRKIFLIVCLLQGLPSLALAADVTLTLTDGATLQGELVKSDDKGLQLHVGETFTNIAWPQLSQDSLKQLAADPKIKPRVEPFIDPEVSQHPAKAEIKINPVNRLERPEHPSISLGLLTSSVGKFIIFVLYLANLWAAYEISIVKARPAAQVMGIAAILPLIGPIVFLIMPMLVPPPPEENREMVAPAGTQGAAAAAAAADPEAYAAAAAAKPPEEKKIEPQIFARGKFTFNKRFVETKFAGFIGGEPKGEALKFWMEVKSSAAHFAVQHIAQVGAAEAIFETPNGQITVPFADILEIKLNPRPAA